MMTFAQTWKRQEQARHQLLLQELKSELAANRTPIAPPAPPSPAAATPIPRPKPNKPRPKTQELLQTIAIR